MKHLDFLVIGAQKCATTTLFELLRQHPRINMPLEKEVPFFTRDDGDWAEFAARNFGVDDGRLWGKATPQYMGDPQVPERLAAAMPGVRLIALLRDPIARSRSHYRMAVRRCTEARDVDRAMRDCLDPQALTAARRCGAPTHDGGYESESDFYLVWSEYGRILAAYRAAFPREQLLVLFTEELEARPVATLARVLAFLGLPDQGFEPRGLGEVMHAGGGGPRIPHGLRRWLRQRRAVAALWRCVPAQQQGRLRFLYERWNTRRTREALPIAAATEDALRRHFVRDLELWEGIGLPMPPWAAGYRAAAALQNAKESVALCDP